MLRRDKKEEEAGNPYERLDKTAVLQEARSVFNSTPVNARKCQIILTKLLFIISKGEHLGPNEATDTFFAMTKLFQCKDVTLRRMVYLVIKDMAEIAEDVIIVTSSLTKDMTGKEDQFRGPAIRALCKITDTGMLQSIERYMKQAIVDKVHPVASAALVSSLHLCKTSMDVTKRWVNEAQEAVNADNVMVQYHALGLLYHIRKHDKLAVTKLVQKFTRSQLKSPYAMCLLIRIAAKLVEEEDLGCDGPLFDLIEGCLRHKSEIVIYEAAHAIVNMKQTSSKELAPAVSVLQLFCSSPKPTLRFAAVKTLNKVAMKHPAAVTACNLDLENLITDSNRSIATLAITTLLKTGSESSVDRLMKQIASFMSEISDEFKIVVVEAIRALCQKYPRKHGVMMQFLSSMLREEGGFEYKKAIVNTIITIIDENGDGKEAGLSHLCEFIEDCEHTVLATRILHLLGREGPRTPQPSKYIRFIYNRVILESAAVRAAAVTALAKFGAHCEELLDSIIVLLERCCMDTDDEVRDRATLYLTILQQRQTALNSHFILNGLQVSIVGLERALHNYSTNLAPSAPFDMKTVPIDTQPMAEQRSSGMGMGLSATGEPRADAKKVANTQDVYAEQLAAVPQIAKLGTVFKSAQAVELTESETEYVVRCVKHVFPNHLVFQFDCTNTLNDQVLENVSVQMESAEGYTVVSTVEADRLGYNTPGITYTIVELPPDGAVSGTFTCLLKYLVKDCDPSTGETDDEGYDDEYALEDVDVAVADYMQRVSLANFGAAWEELGPEHELEDTFSLSHMTYLEEAVKEIVKFLGMAPCERSDKVTDGKSSHQLLLAGVFTGGHKTLVRAKLALSDGVTMQLTVRSTDANTSEIVVSAIG
ncbi:coatomer subunit gamma-2-like [Watersipora subatra]|uniref:coatomer subunit gamma-2-like n=1 Tax=Watersipora subatra TaxID=2589382 RepID=UPI00355B226E